MRNEISRSQGLVKKKAGIRQTLRQQQAEQYASDWISRGKYLNHAISPQNLMKIVHLFQKKKKLSNEYGMEEN